MSCAQAAPAIIDIDEWARVFALQSLSGAADVYTRGGLHHNIQFYVRPSDNRVLALPWDWDFAFTASARQPLIGTQGTGGRLMSLPGVRRMVYGHLLDIIQTTFNNEYLDPWIEHYGQVARQNLNSIKSYVTQRRDYVLTALPEQFPFEITHEVGQALQVATPDALLTGRGWINVRTIVDTRTGESLDVQWLDDENWQARVVVADGSQKVELQAIDHQGRVVGVQTITVQLTRGDFNLDGSVDAADIDLLAAGIQANDRQLDVDGSGSTDAKDLDYMIHAVLQTSFGDTNLNGTFDSADLVAAFQIGEYEDNVVKNSQWSDGDWNGDQEFDTSDLVIAFQDGGFVPAAHVAASLPATSQLSQHSLGAAAARVEWYPWRHRVSIVTRPTTKVGPVAATVNDTTESQLRRHLQASAVDLLFAHDEVRFRRIRQVRDAVSSPDSPMLTDDLDAATIVPLAADAPSGRRTPRT